MKRELCGFSSKGLGRVYVFNMADEGDDEELNELLDSALDDFDKVQTSAKQQTSFPSDDVKQTGQDTSDNIKQSKPAVSAATEPDDKLPPSSSPSQNLEQMFAESFAEAAGDLEKAMKAMLGEGDDEIMRHLQNQLSQGVSTHMSGQGTGSQASLRDMEANLARTMSELAQNAKDMENCSLDSMNEDFIKAMSGMNLEGAEGFMPLMQGMMKNLLAKEVLYPNLKELYEKYPDWLEKNRNSVSAEEHARYVKQYKLVGEICAEYELDSEEDSDEVKKKRFEKLMELMQKMQELGQPPTELVGEMPPGLNFGQEMPTMPEIPEDLQNECKVS